MTKDKKAILIGVDGVILPLVERFIEEGHLPHLKKLIETGAADEAAPCLPPYTPTNWATLANGALPDTHGAGNWYDNEVSEPIMEKPGLSTFDSRTITAESIWEAAEKEGLRSLCIAYPSAYPKRTKNGYVVAPIPRGLTSLRMQSGAEYAIQPSLPGGIPLEVRSARDWSGAPDGALESRLVVQEPSENSAGLGFDLLAVDTEGRGYDQVLICENKDAAHPLAELKVGDWSPWIVRDLDVGPASVTMSGLRIRFEKTDVDLEGRRPGSMRFKLLRLSPGGNELRLVRSEIYPTTSFTDPDGLSEELIREVGPFYEHQAALPLPKIIEHDPEMVETMLEEIRYQALWYPRAAGYVQEKYGWEIYYQHWHWPDSIHHRCLRPIEPESPTYDPDKAEIYLDFIRRSYQIMDEMVGGFLELADEQTYVVVVSDHGCTPDYRVANVQRRLLEKGLSVPADKTDVPPAMGLGLDIARSRAFQVGPIHVAINLKGRNSKGIVDPEDYEQVQEEIIDALQTWRDPDTGKLVIALALKKRDAQLLGYWGKRTGDVLYMFNHGFWWGDASVAPLFQADPDATVVDAPPNSGHHGPNLATDRTSLTSNLATFIIRGPGIKAGFSRDPEQRGFVQLKDIVPTLSYLLGFNPPRECEGAVLWDHLEDV